MPARAFQDNPEPFKAIQRYLRLSKTVQDSSEHLNCLEQSNNFEIILKFLLGVIPLQTTQNDASKAIQRHPERSHTFTTISKSVMPFYLHSFFYK